MTTPCDTCGKLPTTDTGGDIMLCANCRDQADTDDQTIGPHGAYTYKIEDPDETPGNQIIIIKDPATGNELIAMTGEELADLYRQIFHSSE